MAATIDDIIAKIDVLIDTLKRTPNYDPSSKGWRDDTSINGLAERIKRINEHLQNMEDGLEEWDTFQKKKYEREKKHLEKLEKLYEEETKLQKDHNKKLEEIHNKRKELEKQINDLEEKKKKALTQREKDNINKQIRYRQNKLQDLDEQETNENTQFQEQRDITIEKRRAKEKRIKKRFKERESFMDFQSNLFKERYGGNINNAKILQRDLGNYSRQLRLMGRSVSKVSPKLGRAFTSTSRAAASMATGLSKAIPVIGWVIAALQELGGAVRKVANNHVEFRKIQMAQRDAATKFNTTFAKITAEGLTDEIKTFTANSLLDLEYVGQKAIAEQSIENAINQNAVATQLGAMTSGYNTASWESLSRKRDIDAERQKYLLMFGDGTEDNKGFLAEEQELERKLNNLTFKNNQQIREINKAEAQLEYTEETLKNERALEDAIVNQSSGVVSKLTGLKLNSFAAGAQATLYDFDQKGNSVGGIRATDSVNGFSKYESIVQGVNVAQLSHGVSGAIIGKNVATSMRDIKRIEEDNQLNIQKNILLEQATQTELTKELTEIMEDSKNQIKKTRIELSKNISETGIDATTEMQKSYDQFAKTIVDWTLKFEKISLDSAAGKGLTTASQNKQYMNFMNEATRTLSKWGLGPDEVMKMQNIYSQGTGRSMIASLTDLDKAAAVGKYLGDNGLAIEIANSTEIFNMGMSTTMENMWKITKSVNRMGLDGRKYMKDIAKNLKMAQKYNFRDGVQGLMNMSRWAQNVRFNMSSLPAMIDDILDNGLEGVITKGAKLQVLGGNFAMGADPLAMLYEAGSSPEELAKRYNSMLQGMGTWNSKTGKVDFNWVESQQMRLFAQYTGQALEDVRNQASYQIKKEKIGQYISGSDLNKEQRDLLINKAYYEGGEWKVNTIDGNKMRLSEINEKNINRVQAETHEGVVEQSLQTIIGYLDKSMGLVQEENATFADALIQDSKYYEFQEKMYEAQKEFFTKKFGKSYEELLKSYGDNTENFIEMLHQDIISPTDKTNIYLNSIAVAVEAIRKKYAPLETKANEMTNASSSKSSKSATPNHSNDIRYERTSAQVMTEIGAKMMKESKSVGEWVKGLWISSSGSSAMYAQDGVLSSNGQSMLTAATNVTPIHDGSVQLTKSDPQDTAIFAKTGGPFDTLFNGIFAKINDIHSKILPRSMEYTMPMETTISKIFDGDKYTTNNPKLQMETVKVEINGKLILANGNGQGVDIINELKNNPLLIRQLTELISENISKSINGGRATYDGITQTSRFNSMGI